MTGRALSNMQNNDELKAAPPPVPYGRDDPLRLPHDLVVEHFADGGVTVRLPARWRPRSRDFWFWQVLVIYGALAFATFGCWAPWHVVRSPLFVVGAVALGWLLYKAYFAGGKPKRQVPEVVGISPQAVYVDVPPTPAFEAPRADLLDVRVVQSIHGARWATGVEVVVAGRKPVLVCQGRREKEIWDAYEALRAAAEATQPCAR